MDTYLVRLTVEGEHEEQTVLAQHALHAGRQALTLWWNLEPQEDAVIAIRKAHAGPPAPHEPRRSLADPPARTAGLSAAGAPKL